MPISHRIRQRPEGQPRHTHELPLIGSVRVGERVTSARDSSKVYPTSLDYFKFTEMGSGHVHRDIQFIESILGPKPKSIIIFFHTDDITQISQNYYEWRITGKPHKVAEGDGVEFKYRNPNPKSNQLWLYGTREQAAAAWTSKENGTPLFTEKEMLRIKFRIDGLDSMIGLWQLVTGGRDTSIPQMLDHIDYVHKTANRIMGIPFMLSVSKPTVADPHDPRSFPVVSIRAMPGANELERYRQLTSNEELKGFLTSSTIRQFQATLKGEAPPPPQPEKTEAIAEAVEYVEVPAEAAAQPPSPPEPTTDEVDPLGVPLDPEKAYKYVKGQLTEEQRKALNTRAKAHNIPLDQIKAWVVEKYREANGDTQLLFPQQ